MKIPSHRPGLRVMAHLVGADAAAGDTIPIAFGAVFQFVFSFDGGAAQPSLSRLVMNENTSPMITIFCSAVNLPVELMALTMLRHMVARPMPSGLSTFL